MTARLYLGDALDVLRTLPDGAARCCVTSPPYWGLRDYGVPGQFGLERTPEEYVARLVEVFREVRRVLTDDGTLWLNLGDSYASSGGAAGGGYDGGILASPGREDEAGTRCRNRVAGTSGLKPKDLVGIPWLVAFALRADGWYLRSDIVWSKPNPMPESVTDRPTKAHEHVFLLSKGQRYFYDAAAIAEPLTESTVARLSQAVEAQRGSDRVPGKTNRREGLRRSSKSTCERIKAGGCDMADYPVSGCTCEAIYQRPCPECEAAGYAQPKCWTCDGGGWEKTDDPDVAEYWEGCLVIVHQEDCGYGQF